VTAGSKGRFKPYPAYKDSGVDWLGAIPEHWDAKRLKCVVRMNPETLREGTDPSQEIVYIDIGGVDSLGAVVDSEVLVFNAAPSRARRVVRAGDVIVSTVRTYLRAIAAIHDPVPGTIVSTGFAVIRPTIALRGDYTAYALRAPYFVERVVASSKGVSFPAISENEMATYEIAVPPASEQRAIAAFLDRETARIDALVAKKERLIELLQEQRTALINRAVTKGLDPTVPTKDSGVEWLGVIPAHWEVVRSKRLFRLRNMRALASDSQLTASQQHGVIPQADFMALEGRRVVQVVTGADILKHVEARDFVISMRSFQGGIEWSPHSGAISSAYVVLAPLGGVCHSYFAYLLKSERYIQALQSTSDLVRDGQALRFDNFAQVALPAVPFAEQRDIAVYLERQSSRIDALVAKMRSAVDRLKEYRTAIISAAVTGKIDVGGRTV